MSSGDVLVWDPTPDPETGTGTWVSQADAHPVLSVFGRTGAVVAVDGDYSFGLLGGDIVDSDTAELNTSLVLQPDGAGKVTWGSVSGGNSAWDHIVESTADLPAISGNAYILTSGSWAFKNSIDLGTDKIEIPTGVDVLLGGMGGTKTITSNRNGAVVDFEAGSTGRLWGLSVENTNGNSTASALELATTDYVYVTLGDFTAPSGRGVEVAAGGKFFFNQCHFHDAVDAIYIDATAAEVTIVNSTWVDVTECVNIQTTSGLSIIGGRMDAFTDGVGINGNLSSLDLIGVECENGEDFVDYNSGSVIRAAVIGCSAASMLEVIRWAAASIPSLGLTISANKWNVATPFNGFDHTTARVNSKGNVDSSGLMSETAIVP